MNMQYHPGTTIVRSQGNAFQRVPRSTKPDSFRAPLKRGPKPSPNERSAISLETFAERQAKKQRAALLAKATRVNKNNLIINHRSQADVDKIGALTGRGTPLGRDL